MHRTNRTTNWTNGVRVRHIIYLEPISPISGPISPMQCLGTPTFLTSRNLYLQPLSCLQLLSASLQPLTVEDCCEEADVDVEGESIPREEEPRPGKAADVDVEGEPESGEVEPRPRPGEAADVDVEGEPESDKEEPRPRSRKEAHVDVKGVSIPGEEEPRLRPGEEADVDVEEDPYPMNRNPDSGEETDVDVEEESESIVSDSASGSTCIPFLVSMSKRHSCCRFSTALLLLQFCLSICPSTLLCWQVVSLTSNSALLSSGMPRDSSPLCCRLHR